MFMVKATSREKILKDAKPDELYALFEQWRKWLDPHVHYLIPRPDRPGWCVAPEVALERSWTTQDYNMPKDPFAKWDSPVGTPDRGIMRTILAKSYHVPKECRDLWTSCVDREKEESGGTAGSSGHHEEQR